MIKYIFLLLSIVGFTLNSADTTSSKNKEYLRLLDEKIKKTINEQLKQSNNMLCVCVYINLTTNENIPFDLTADNCDHYAPHIIHNRYNINFDADSTVGDFITCLLKNEKYDIKSIKAVSGLMPNGVIEITDMNTKLSAFHIYQGDDKYFPWICLTVSGLPK